MTEPECVFCRIVRGELPSYPVASDERTIAFLDLNPATRGHTLVVPRTHAVDLHDVGAEDLVACALAAQRIADRLRDTLGANGVNLINASGTAAWQTVFHFHVHVIPRYVNDALRAPWEPHPGNPAELQEVGTLLSGAAGA